MVSVFSAYMYVRALIGSILRSDCGVLRPVYLLYVVDAIVVLNNKVQLLV